MNTNYTPSPLGPGVLKAGLDNVMSLYPDDPNPNAGIGPGFKRGAAISMAFHALDIILY